MLEFFFNEQALAYIKLLLHKTYFCNVSDAMSLRLDYIFFRLKLFSLFYQVHLFTFLGDAKKKDAKKADLEIFDRFNPRYEDHDYVPQYFSGQNAPSYSYILFIFDKSSKMVGHQRLLQVSHTPYVFITAGRLVIYITYKRKNVIIGKKFGHWPQKGADNIFEFYLKYSKRGGTRFALNLIIS